MTINDNSKKQAIIGLVCSLILFLSYFLLPDRWVERGGNIKLSYGILAASSCVFCQLFKYKRFKKYKAIVELHPFVGLIGWLSLFLHAGLAHGMAGFPNSFSELALLFHLVIISGIINYIFKHLVILTKGAKTPKAELAADIINKHFKVSNKLHSVLVYPLYILLIEHLWVILYY